MGAFVDADAVFTVKTARPFHLTIGEELESALERQGLLANTLSSRRLSNFRTSSHVLAAFLVPLLVLEALRFQMSVLPTPSCARPSLCLHAISGWLCPTIPFSTLTLVV